MAVAGMLCSDMTPSATVNAAIAPELGERARGQDAVDRREMDGGGGGSVVEKEYGFIP